MKFRRLWPLGLAALAIAQATQASAPASAQSDAPESSAVPGWSELIETLRDLPDRMLEKLPEEKRRDPQLRQEAARLALAALASSAIETLGGDGNAPQFLPVLGQVFNVGQPNADTVYRAASITPGASYRLRGRQGSVNHAILAQFLPPGAQGEGGRPHLDLSTLATDEDGRFDLLISPEKPEGHEGDWWALNPAANRMMIRMVSSDWARELEPTLSIERVDQPITRPRVPAAVLEAKLRALPRAVDFIALMFVGHHGKMREEGLVNRVRTYNVGMGALDGQFYYEGAYDLAEDEALIIESDVPKSCMYRSLILTNELYETTDWYNNHSSLNGSQAAPDSDGKLRIVIANRDPGVKNWLDTAGYPRGVIQGRWTGCDSQPIPTVTKVTLGNLRKHLPADVATVSPEEREAIIRERRRALQERPLW